MHAVLSRVCVCAHVCMCILLGLDVFNYKQVLISPDLGSAEEIFLVDMIPTPSSTDNRAWNLENAADIFVVKYLITSLLCSL